MILLVSRAAILETKTGRCASGNIVLGAEAELVRFVVALEAGPLAEEDDGIRVVVLGTERRRLGRDGTANVWDANVLSFEDFVCFSCGAETKVNGSIGYGVSDGK